jgi:hypothetical protein
MIVRLLEKEALLFPSSPVVYKSDPWREKVIHWFFSVVSALARNQPAGIEHPFDRATVHVSTALMDSYLASLPCERSARYKMNRVAYQVLATSCLLLGMRLVAHHQRVEAVRRRHMKEVPPAEMKRSRKLQDLHAQEAVDSTAATESAVLEIPNVSSILRISAASKSISEAKILAMVKEITSTRVFPRSHSVTALDFIRVFSRNTSNVSSSSSDTLLLEPSQQSNASLLADAGLFCSICKPSIVACAAITVAMMRSVPEQDVTAVRQRVFHSVYGEHDMSAMQSVRDVESRLVRASTANPRNGHQVVPRPLSGHVIPQEE